MAGSSRIRYSRITPSAAIFSIAFHLVVFIAITQSLRPLPDEPSVPVMRVELLPNLTDLSPQDHRTAARTSRAHLISLRPHTPQSPLPALVPNMAASIPGAGPVFDEPKSLEDVNLRKALRSSIGCVNADAVGLTAEERNHCQHRMRELGAEAREIDTLPADPTRRAAIEHMAHSDSIMKDYRKSPRMDVGDYPGLRTLLGKDPLPPTDPSSN